MLRRRTVFVLGAGASRPYGFPTGIQLVDQIRHEIEDGTPLITRLENLAERLRLKASISQRFAMALKGAKPYSIDAFLEANEQYREIGKAAIADVLLRAEDSKKLNEAIVEEDW